MKNFKILLPFTVFSLLFVGCSEKSFHDEMINKTKQSFDKKEYDDIKQSYSDALVDEKFKNKEFISKEADKVSQMSYDNYDNSGNLWLKYPTYIGGFDYPFYFK